MNLSMVFFQSLQPYMYLKEQVGFNMWIIKVVLINWIRDISTECSIQVILKQQRA